MPLRSLTGQGAVLSAALCAGGCDLATDVPEPVPDTAAELAPNASLLASLMTVNLSSYFGGSNFDQARDVAIDRSGNIYIVGGTRSSNFPTTAGVLQRVHNPGTPSKSGIQRMDAFVMKLSPAGRIIWSTFLGGPNYDRAYAVEVDGSGNVYVVGRAGAGFPVTPSAFQTTFRGGEEATFYGPQDGFICKLNATGSARIYCSYFGTTDPNVVRDVAVDAQGNAYLAASAGVNGLPTIWFANGYRRTRAGGVDGVVAKVTPTGARVLWATYVGGSRNEGNGENSIRVDGSGVYFLQQTSSAGLPTPGGFDRTLGGSSDAYLVKLAPSGRSLVYGTYIGGSGAEFMETHSLAVDGGGRAHVVVTTASTDFPTTSGAFQRRYGGSGGSGTGARTNYGHDIGVMKLSPTGTLLASTYLGGRYGEGAEGIAVDPQGNVYVSGATYSSNYPVTVSSFLGRGGGADVCATKLSPNLGALVFSQRIGGSKNDYGRGVHVDGSGRFLIVGETSSSNFPLLNALSGFRGGTDGLLVRLTPGG